MDGKTQKKRKIKETCKWNGTCDIVNLIIIRTMRWCSWVYDMGKTQTQNKKKTITVM